MQINRLFEIIYILLDKKNMTAGELAEHFGVSRRTICRDIDTLSIAGIPLYTVRGKGGGIRLLPEYVLNKSLLNEREQDEILSSLNSLASIRTDGTDQILRKLSSVFGKNTPNWMEAEFPGWSHENDYFSSIKTAVLERRIVRFEYYDSHGGRTFRSAEPVQLWFKSRAWYLKGYCLDRQDIRLFKVSRIKNFVVTDEIFAQRDLSDLSEDLVPDTSERNAARIKLRVAPERAYRVFDDFYEDMTEKQPDGSFLITVSWPEDDWLYGFILSFGKYIEVIEPEHLRAAVKEKALEISDKYS